MVSSKRKVLVSVIVPTLNEEKWVVKCVNSIKNQTIPKTEYEIIVVDSSSDDKTVKKAKKVADRVKVCKRISGGHGKNVGAKMARGRYLAFVDADTLVSKTWLEGVIEGLQRGVGVTGPFETIEKDSLKIELFFKWWNLQDRISVLIGLPIFPGFNMAIRKKEFKKLGGFYDMTAEDMDISFRLRKLGKVNFSKKMSVRTSNRRLKEIPILPYMGGGIKYFLFRRGNSWSQHRKDFDKK